MSARVVLSRMLLRGQHNSSSGAIAKLIETPPSYHFAGGSGTLEPTFRVPFICSLNCSSVPTKNSS